MNLGYGNINFRMKDSHFKRLQPINNGNRKNISGINSRAFQSKQQIASANSKLINQNWFQQPVIDPRDIKIAMSYQELNNLFTDQFSQKQKIALRKWLVKLYENISSDGFYKFHNQQLTQHEFKAYISKNIIYHIDAVFTKVGPKVTDKTRRQIMNFINEQSQRIFNYVILKYPQQASKGTYRRLRKKMPKVDIRAKDTYDMLRYIPQRINLSQQIDGDYTQEIMKIINYLIQLPSSYVNNKEQDYTMFQALQTMIQLIVNMKTDVNVQDQINNYMNQYKEFQIHTFKKFFDQFHVGYCSHDIQMKINQKIHSSTQIFTQEEIKNGQFRVLDSSVLRIMTKWAEQLQARLKDAKKQFIDKSLKFKLQNGGQQSLTANAVKQIIRIAQNQWSEIGNYFHQIKSNLINMEQQLFSHEYQGKYLNNVDTNVGIFAARTQSCLGQYLLHYINKLLHALAHLPKQLSRNLQIREQYLNQNQKKQHKKQAQKQEQIQAAKEVLIPERMKFDFVTFKIGDIMRAKVKAPQQTLISILNKMEALSQKLPQIFKLVRVKDRLDRKDNDILINFFFMNKALCQIQFSVTKNQKIKDQNYNNFNHFIYQLTRTKFGPIAQCACIAIQYDPLARNLSQRKNILPDTLNNKSSKKISHGVTQLLLSKNKELLRKQSLVFKQKKMNIFPYFCSSKCGLLIKNTNPTLFDQKIHSSVFKECNSCYVQRLYEENGQEVLIQHLFKNRSKNQNQIKVFLNHLRFCNEINMFEQFIEKVGSIRKQKYTGRGFAFKKNNKNLKPIYFKLVQDQQSLNYLMTSFQGQKIKILFQIPSKGQGDQQDHRQAIQKLFQVFFIIFLDHKNHKNYSEIKIKLLQEQQKSADQKDFVIHKQLLQCKKCEIQGFKLASFKGNYSQEIIRSLNLKDLYLMIQKRKEQYVGTGKGIKNQFELINGSKNLKVLKIGGNQISIANFINKFPSLIVLDLNANKITQLPDFSLNKKIKTLNLNSNLFKSLEPLSIISDLQILDISYSEVNNFNGLAGCTKLKQLKALSLNNLSSFQGIQKMTSLQIFQCSSPDYNCLIQNYQSLKNLIKITHLTLNFFYEVKTIQHLKFLNNLEKLQLKSSMLVSLQDKEKKIKQRQLQDNYNQNYYENNEQSNEQQNKKQKEDQQIKKDKQNKQSMQRQITNSKNQILEFSQKLREIDFSYDQLIDLEGFQKFIYLEKLTVSTNYLTSLKGIQKLENLKYLQANDNRIQQIIEFQNSKLSYLDLSNNYLKSIKGLSKLKELTFLNLNINGQLSSLQGLRNLQKLQTLQIQQCSITTLENIQNLPSLQKLTCHHNQITSFKGIQNCTNLIIIKAQNNKIKTLEDLLLMHYIEELSLNQNQIQNLIGLEGMTRLNRLILNNNKLNSLKGVENCTNLITLNLMDNYLSSLEQLKEMKKLEWFAFERNKVQSLKGCQNMLSVKKFFGSDNQFKSVIQIRGMKNLQLINIGNNQVQSLQGFQNLLNLQELAIQNNKISSLEGLSNLPKLKKLFLRFNQLQNLKGLSNIKDSINLKIFIAENNKLTSIKGIQHFPNIQQFSIKNNKVISLQGLQNNSSIIKLYLDDNQIQSLAQLKNMKKLQLIGLMNNKVTSLHGIEQAIQNDALYFHNNPFESVQPLQNYQRLRLLVLQDNKLKSLKGLQKIVTLTQLYIIRNQIQSVQQLEKLVQVFTLNLTSNKIKSLKGIQYMKRLYLIYANNNQIESLEDISEMYWVTQINVQNNKIKSFKGIQKMNSVSNISAEGNPIEDISVLENIKSSYIIVNGDYQETYIKNYKTQHGLIKPDKENQENNQEVNNEQQNLNKEQEGQAQALDKQDNPAN